MKKQIWLWFFLFLFIFVACAKKQPIDRGFYYWKTNFKLNQTEVSKLEQLQTKSLYIRIFDVDWDFNQHHAIPKGAQKATPIFPKEINVTPTIYLTNRSLQHTSFKGIDTLAQNVLAYTKIIVDKWSIVPKRIQLDVDWTKTTQEKFFKLLRLIKTKGPFSIVSSTIRLHQYKYPDMTGIPPVDEGVLMCYNTGSIKEWETTNSIATENDINAYLNGKSIYPIPLGIALPIFSWTVIFRDGAFFKIISDGDLTWQQDSIHYKAIGSNRFEVKSNTYLYGHFLYEGDQLRYEHIASKELNIFAARLAKKQNFKEVLFYHLSADNLGQYNVETLNQVYQKFEK